jgi:hypothetical protein
MTVAKRNVDREVGARRTIANGVRGVAVVAAIFFWSASAAAFVSIHEGGQWPAGWPSQLEPYRNRARTFEIGTGGVRENVYEIRFEKVEDFELIWPTILELRSVGASLRVCNVEESGQERKEVLPNNAPVVRIYAPVYGSSAQKPGGKVLPVGPPWPQSIMLPDGTLPEYVAISEDGMQWVPAVGKVPNGFRHRARVEIELVADGRILDFNRILVPRETPIVDKRTSSEPRLGATWYVSPQGKPDNAGTADAPWDLASTLAGRQNVQAGDTVYLLEGTYRRRPNELFEVRLRGAAEDPIQIRPMTGQRVTIDGGLSIVRPAAHVWISDLEILVSESLQTQPAAPGAGPANSQRPAGGLQMHGGSDCKYINLIIHHCSQGISCWKDELNPEIYGCILYGNGWVDADGGHGHCIATQNDQGTKTISNCILTCPYEGCHTVYACGAEKAYVNNYLLTENICYERGPFLVGGVRPSQSVRIRRNVLYGIDMQVGYNAPYNEDCEVRENVVVNGKLETARYRKMTWDGNIILPTADTTRPSKNKYVLLPNRYDRNRAHLAVFNWDDATIVDVETGRCVSEGDTVQLFDPEDLFGNAMAKLVCRDGRIHVPICGEFAAFVVKISRR